MFLKMTKKVKLINSDYLINACEKKTSCLWDAKKYADRKIITLEKRRVLPEHLNVNISFRELRIKENNRLESMEHLVLKKLGAMLIGEKKAIYDKDNGGTSRGCPDVLTEDETICVECGTLGRPPFFPQRFERILGHLQHYKTVIHIPYSFIDDNEIHVFRRGKNWKGYQDYMERRIIDEFETKITEAW